MHKYDAPNIALGQAMFRQVGRQYHAVEFFDQVSRLRPRLQFDSADALELADVVGDEREATGQGLAGNKQVIMPDRGSLTLQRRANVRGGFGSGTVQWQFDDGGNEALDFLPLLCWVLRHGKSAKQLIDGHH